MSNPLNDAITLQVDAEGNLLYADPAFRRLHIKAGGVDGGKVAMPSIANIAMLTHKLKTPLSRRVNLADQDFDIELWIDSHIDDDVAILSILGWNEKHIIYDNEPDGQTLEINAPQNNILFLCNEDNVIISFKSDEQYVAAFGHCIGHKIFDLIASNISATDALEGAFEEKQPIDHHIVTIKDWDGAYEFSAIPRWDDTKKYIGYECYISPLNNDFKTDALSETIITETDYSVIYKGLMSAQLGPAIRQPLGRIIANAETIGSKLQGPIRENYANYAKDIASAARHLIEIVDDLGDLEALDRPNFEIAKDDIELGDIAKRLSGLMALKASDKNITIKIEGGDSNIYAVGEFRRVLQIGINLLTNAVRYSPEHTNIIVSLGLIGDGTYLSVKDQGPGISVDKHYKIFEKFERLGRTGDGGSGLGLYISHRLAQAMGGDLILESKEGDGACFTLLLPKKKEAPNDASDIS